MDDLKLHQYLTRRPPLDALDQIADRNVRRYRYEDVNMIPRDVPFQDLNVFGLATFTH